MNKKFFSTIVTLLAAILTFGACGGGTTPSNGNSATGGNSEATSQSGSFDVGGCVEEHVDTDNNEKCDVCGNGVTETFDLFSVNDLHGKFADSDTQPGVDELSTYLKNAKKANENTIVLSSGDMWQGSSESNLTKGLIITDWMNEMDFASLTLGNHEYDWGTEYIASNAEKAEFPFLAINVYDNKTNQRVDYCQSSVMVEQNGVKVGIIGAIGDCYSSISSDKVQDVYFKVGSELTALVKAESDKLRKEGADCIVYSIHDGYGKSYDEEEKTVSNSQISSYYDISLSDGYVDIVFEGHSHQRYVLKDSEGIYHLQGGGDNDGISHAKIKINYANETCNVLKAEYVATYQYENLADDTVVETLLGKYEEVIAKASRVLGMNDTLRESNEILNVCAQLYYQAGVERWGKDYNIVLGGGYMSVRSPYELFAGQVLYGDLMSILPFDNSLVLCSVSGYYLRQKFLETDNPNYYIFCGEYGASIRNNINDNETYYLVTDSYSSTYGPNHLTEIERYDETTFARDLLAKYIEEGGFTSSDTDITLTSIPELLRIADALSDNAQTAVEYYVKGTITEIVSTTYGNMYIKDENGNVLYIYGIYDATNTIRFDGMTNPPKVGDTVIVKGAMKKYVKDASSEPILEIQRGKLISIL